MLNENTVCFRLITGLSFWTRNSQGPASFVFFSDGFGGGWNADISKSTKKVRSNMKQEFFARQANEEIIRQERFHPGIFVIPVLCFVALLVPTLPLAIVASMTSRMLQQLNSHASYFSLLWLLPVALDFFIALAVFTVIFMAYESSQIILTNKRLVYRTGVISRSRGDLPLENVDSIFIFEPLIGRLAGYGTVTVATLGGLRVPLGFVGKPDVFYTALQRAVANAKNSRSQPAIDKSPVTAPLSADDSRYMPKSR